MSNVLLVGSSSGVLEIAKKIKDYGFRLIVLGGIQDDPAHSIADESIFADYRDIKSCVYECKDKEIENVVPGSNDIAFDCALAIADELGIKTFDSSHVIEQLHNKTQFRKLLTNCQIPQPKIYSKKDVEAQGFNSWPIMVKPELAFSGNGITIIDNKDQLHSAVNRAKKISRNGGISIEQFVSGDLYSVSTFIAQEDIAYSFFANEFCNLNQFAVDYSYTPSNLSHSIQSAILLDIEKILKKLLLKDGLLHFQFIYDPLTSTYYFIECMRRMIGDFYGKKISIAYDIDYSDLYLRPYLNKKIIPKAIFTAPKKIHRKIIASNANYLFESIKNINQDKIIEYIPLETSGAQIREFPHGKAGILFFEKGTN